MRNNKKKGFTLVELLVVIAILAILATVSVVGYTSYIESTTIKVDEDLAAQLNNFLATVKADYDGEYFEELSKNGVTANNVVEITNYILSTGGVGSLTPKSADYGYHFYFDLVDQKYLLISDKDDRINSLSLFSRLIHADESTQTAHPELAIAKDARYFLVETGTPLAELVAEFRAIESKEQLNDYYNRVAEYETDNGKQLTGLVTLVKETVFTTDNGHFIVSGTTDHKHLFVQNGLVVTNKNNHEKMSINGSDIITKDAPLVTLQDNQTIVLGLADGVTLAKHSFWFADGSKATLVIDGINTLEELITRVDVDFTNANIVVGGKTYTVTGPTFKDAEGNPVTDENGEDIVIEEKNKVTSFSYTVSNDKAGKIDFNNGFIAIDGGTFTLSADNFKGLLNDEVSTKEVRWTITSAYYYELDADNNQVMVEYTPTEIAKFLSAPANGQNSTFTITLPANETLKLDGIVINARSVIGNNPDGYNIELKVRRPIGVTGLTMDGKPIASDTELNLANGEATKYTLNTGFTLEYNYTEGSNVVVDAVTPVMSGIANSSFDFGDGTTLALESGKTELLVAENVIANFNNYFSLTFKVSMFDALNLSFNKANDKIVLVGDDNAVTIGDLVKLNDGFSIPANAEIWFMKDFGETFAKPGPIDGTKGMAAGYLDNTKIAMNDGDAWASTPVQFVNGKGAATKEEAVEITVVVVVPDASSSTGYRCISQPRTVALIDATNVKTYADMTASMDLTKTDLTSGHPLKSNIVFLADITMDSTANYFAIPAGKTVYGNTFTFNIKAGRKVEAGIINLYGRIQDTKILGDVYTGFAVSVGSNWGSAAICTKGAASEIENCYISGCRSPLRVEKDVVVTDSVFYGGRYANIDVVGGNLYIKGEVITVNQPYKHTDNKTYVGMGIAFWWSTSGDVSKVIIDTDEQGNEIAKLTQYNFISQNDAGAMPKIGIVELAAEAGVNLPSIIGSFLPNLGIDLGSIFTNKIMGDSAYSDGIFIKNNVKYVNTGVVYISEAVDSEDAIFQHLGKYANSSYTYNPANEKYLSIFNSTAQDVFKSVLKSKTGIETLPIFINSLKAQVPNADATGKINHTENYAFLDTALANAANYSPSHDFGADGNILTYGE